MTAAGILGSVPIMKVKHAILLLHSVIRVGITAKMRFQQRRWVTQLFNLLLASEQISIPSCCQTYYHDRDKMQQHVLNTSNLSWRYGDRIMGAIFQDTTTLYVAYRQIHNSSHPPTPSTKDQ